MRPTIITSVAAASSSIKSFVMLEEHRRKTTRDSSSSKCCRVFKKSELRKTWQDRELPDWRSSRVFCLHHNWVIWNQAETPPPPVFYLLTCGCHHLPKRPEEPSGWSQNSSWPCLNRLTPLQLRRLLGFTLWEAPVSPTAPRSLPRIPPGPPPPHPTRPPPFKEPLKVVQEPEAFWDFCPSVCCFLKS